MSALPAPLDRTRLDRSNRLESLLVEGMRCGRIASAQQLSIRLQLSALAVERIHRFTQGDTSSVPLELAQRLMDSVCFTLEVALARTPDPSGQLDALCAQPLKALYQEGRRRLARLLTQARLLHRLLVERTRPVPTQAYRQTLNGALPEFFARYDPEFFAQEIPGLMDYPAAVAPEGAGVEYVLSYLERLRMEAGWLARLPEGCLEALLRAQGPLWQELLVNAAGVALPHLAAGLLLGAPEALPLPAQGLASLEQALGRLSPGEWTELPERLAGQLCARWAIVLSGERAYLTLALSKACGRLHAAFEVGGLAGLLRGPERAAAGAARFEERASLEDAAFRALAEELMRCRHFSDKRALLSRRALSLTDLMELMALGCFGREELPALLAEQSPQALALLAARATPPGALAWEGERGALSLLAGEGGWQAQLARVLEALPPEGARAFSQAYLALMQETEGR